MIQLWKTIKKLTKNKLQNIVVFSYYLYFTIHFIMEPTYVLPCKLARMNTPLLLHCRLFVIPFAPPSSGKVRTEHLQLGNSVYIKLSKADHFH